MARFRDMYASTSRKYISTELNARSFLQLKNKVFRSHSPVFIFKTLWYFHSNPENTTLSENCDSLFQRDMNAPTSRKYASTEPQARSFQQLNNKPFRSHCPVFIFKKLWYFHSNSSNTVLSETCGDSWWHRISEN